MASDIIKSKLIQRNPFSIFSLQKSSTDISQKMLCRLVVQPSPCKPLTKSTTSSIFSYHAISCHIIQKIELCIYDVIDYVIKIFNLLTASVHRSVR